MTTAHSFNNSDMFETVRPVVDETGSIFDDPEVAEQCEEILEQMLDESVEQKELEVQNG